MQLDVAGRIGASPVGDHDAVSECVDALFILHGEGQARNTLAYDVRHSHAHTFYYVV